jgi:hypothetical protein
MTLIIFGIHHMLNMFSTSLGVCVYHCASIKTIFQAEGIFIFTNRNLINCMKRKVTLTIIIFIEQVDKSKISLNTRVYPKVCGLSHNEIYAYLWYYTLRSNTHGYGGKTHYSDSQNSDTTVPSGRELYHLQFSLQAASPETFG